MPDSLKTRRDPHRKKMLFPVKKTHNRGGPSLRSIAASAKRQRQRVQNETPKQRERRLAIARGYRKRKAKRASADAMLQTQIKTEFHDEEYEDLTTTHEEHDPLDVGNLTDSNIDITETKVDVNRLRTSEISDSEIRIDDVYSLNFKNIYFVNVEEGGDVNNICKIESNEEMDQAEEALPKALLSVLRPDNTQRKLPTRNAHPWRFDDPCGSGIISDFPSAHSVVSTSIVTPLDIHLQPIPVPENPSSKPIKTVYALCSEKKLQESKAPVHPSLSRTRPPKNVYPSRRNPQQRNPPRRNPPRVKALPSKYSMMPALPSASKVKLEFAPISPKKLQTSTPEILSQSSTESRYTVSTVNVKTEPEYVPKILPDTSMNQNPRLPFRLKVEPGFDTSLCVEVPLNCSSIQSGCVPFRLKEEHETSTLCMEHEDSSTIQNGHVTFRLKEEHETSTLCMEHEDSSTIQNGHVTFRLKEEHETSTLCMEHALEESSKIQNVQVPFRLKEENETCSLCVTHALEDSSAMDGTELL